MIAFKIGSYQIDKTDHTPKINSDGIIFAIRLTSNLMVPVKKSRNPRRLFETIDLDSILLNNTILFLMVISIIIRGSEGNKK